MGPRSRVRMGQIGHPSAHGIRRRRTGTRPHDPGQMPCSATETAYGRPRARLFQSVHRQMINLKRNAMSLADSLEALVSLGGSDLLISCGSPPRIRKDGTIMPVPGAAEVDSEEIGP